MNPFAVLGLPERFELESSVLEQRVRDLQKALHPDRHSQEGASSRRAALSKAVEVNEAQRALRDPLTRAAALLAVHGRAVREDAGRADPSFLMDVMELREALAEARAARDVTRVRALAARVKTLDETAQKTFAERFAEGALDAAEGALARMRYYRRFLDEVDVFEDDLIENA